LGLSKFGDRLAISASDSPAVGVTASWAFPAANADAIIVSIDKNDSQAASVNRLSADFSCLDG